MPLKAFLRWITDRTEVSIICDQSLDETPVTIDVKDTPLPDILSAVSRRMSVDLTQQNNLYYMGTLKPEDRGVLVRKVRRLGAENLQQTVQVMLSEMGRAAAYSDGLLVVGDRVRVLQRIHSMLDQIEAAESNTWILQLHLVSLQDSLTRELGMETKTNLDIAATFAKSASSLTTEGAFTAMLKAARTNNRASIVAQPVMLLIDGGTSRFKDGESIPVPRKSTTDNGAVVTSGFDTIETGLIIETALREVSPTTAQCSLSIELTSVTGYVETAPITKGQKFSTTAVLESSGVYLLGSMTTKHNQRNKSGALFASMFKTDRTDGDVQIWLRCYRIDGPVRTHGLAKGTNSPGQEEPGE